MSELTYGQNTIFMHIMHKYTFARQDICKDAIEVTVVR